MEVGVVSGGDVWMRQTVSGATIFINNLANEKSNPARCIKVELGHDRIMLN